MARWPEAIWEPVAEHGGALQAQAVTLHHQAGNGDPAAIYRARHVSAHFWLPKSGQPYQHVDSSQQAWHGIQHNKYSLGVETEGCATAPYADPLTEHQLDSFARLMAWANATHGIPLVLSESVSTPGLNYHRCAGGPNTGCPCQVRVDARAEILRRAGGAAPTPAPTPPPASTSTAPPWPGVYLSDYIEHPSARTWQQQMAHRGWHITVDACFGPQSAQVARQFQSEKGLQPVDGIVGPVTWAASWNLPVT